MQSLTFSLTEEDVLAGSLYAAEHSSRVRRVWRRQTLYLALCFALPILFLVVTFRLHWIVLVFLVVAIVIVARHPWYLRKRYVLHVRRLLKDRQESALLGRTQIEVTAAGLYVKNEKNEGLIEWSSVKGMARTDERLYLLVEPGQLIVVPRHSLSLRDVDAFESQVRARLTPPAKRHPT